jgi:hypothetical protein
MPISSLLTILAPNPIHPAGATAAQIQEINRLHLVLLCMYRLYHTIDKVLVWKGWDKQEGSCCDQG